MDKKEARLDGIMRQILNLYTQAGDRPLSQAQVAEIRVLRAQYRAVNGGVDPSHPNPTGRRAKKVEREPANVTPIRSVVSGGLPGLGKRR